MADITIIEEPMTALRNYAQIPSTFTISRKFEVYELQGGLGGIALKERLVTPPREKDYDSFGAPSTLAEMWDLSHWGMIFAFAEGIRVGGCLIAYDTEGVTMLEGRKDITVLWDIRVAPTYRRQGIATRLFTAAVEWSRERHCVAMKIETQNNNVAACRFYAGQSCFLKEIKRFAYSDLPDETQLIWCKSLGLSTGMQK